MIIARKYTLETDDIKGIVKVNNQAAPYCPDCGLLLYGYDSRSRRVIDGSGLARWYALRRLRCLDCDRLHIELPDFIISQKHYDAQTIREAVKNISDSCPADNSTIWRWRQENRPPTLQCHLSLKVIDSVQSINKGAEL